jgi:hypothetical protein
MKLNRIFTLCAVAATLAIGATNLLAQDNTNGDQGGGQRRNRQGGGNFDPAQMQQRMMEGVRDQLEFTNDTDWNAVQPLVQKVMDAQRETMSGRFGGMGRMFRNRGGNNDQGGNNNRPRGGMFGQPSPEAEALQKAIEDNAPSSQIKDLLKKYQASQKAKQAKLEAAQANLRKVLSTKQEAQATLLGLLN